METISGPPLYLLLERNVDGSYPIATLSPQGAYPPIPVEVLVGVLITQKSTPLMTGNCRAIQKDLDFFSLCDSLFSNSGDLYRLLAPLYKCAKGRTDLLMSPLPFGAGFFRSLSS